jgi:vacuolar-type H+-ATPase subunit I/STV1
MFNNLCSASGNLAIKFASFVLQPYIALKTFNSSVLQNGLSALTKFSQTDYACAVMGWVPKSNVKRLKMH